MSAALFLLRWTDEEGRVHVWLLGTGRTGCGRDLGLHTSTRPTIKCSDCFGQADRTDDMTHGHT